MHRRTTILFLMVAIALSAADWDWKLPQGFPRPPVPADNPMTAAKVELGRHLFYDKRISVNGKESCGSCHRQELAFTDGRAHAEGTTGQLHPRSSMSLVNVAYTPLLTWANPTLDSLEEQALIDADDGNPVLRARAAKALRSWLSRLQKIVEQAKERGETRPGVDAKTVAMLIVASLEGALMMSRLQRNEEVLRRVQLHLNSYLENEVAL
jgi:cytochrome c peroxidase